MDNPLFVNERKSSSDLFRPSIYCFKDSRIPGFCWRCFWVIEDLTLQVSFALFHYQDHSCGALFLEKGCAIKLYNVRMLQFSDKQNKKLVRQSEIVPSAMQDCQYVLGHLLPVCNLVVQGPKITYNNCLSRRF